MPRRPSLRLVPAALLAGGLVTATLAPSPAGAWGVTTPVTIAPSGASVSMGADNAGGASAAWVAGGQVWLSSKAPGATAWATPIAVSGDPAVSGTAVQADLDTSPAGHVAVVWTARTADNNTEVWETQRDPGTAYVAPRMVSLADAVNLGDGNAQVDIGSAGMATVVWTGTTAAGATVVRQSQTMATTPPAAPKRLGPETGTATSLELGRGGNGDIVAVWRWSDPTGMTVYVARKTGAGWSAANHGPAFTSVVDPAVAVDGLGRAWVGWSGGAAGAELPYVATIAEGSSTVAPPAQLGSGAGRALRLAANSSGQGAATWVTAAGLSYADLRRNAAPSTGVLVPGAIAAADVGYSDSGAATVAYVPTGQAQVIIAHRPFGQGWTSVPVSAAANARPIVATRADNAVLVWGDSTGGPVQSANVDTTTPVSVHMTAPLKPFNLGTTIAAGWIGADGAGTLTYTVNVARAAYNTRLGAFTTWQQTTATDGAFAAGQGQTVCFQVAAADAAGNASATSSIRCTATPLDDRKLKRKKLHHAKVWRGGKEAGYFNGKGTYVEARKKGATLSLRGVKASRIALLVPRSRSYGTVQVSFGGKVLGKVNLAQKRKGVAKQQIVPVGGTFPLRQGGLKITVVSQKKVVRIDGIYAYGG